MGRLGGNLALSALRVDRLGLRAMGRDAGTDLHSATRNRISPEPAMAGKIVIKGARVHNLKNLDLEIPRDQLVVITGVSGSGKSSLAFDTLYARGSAVIWNLSPSMRVSCSSRWKSRTSIKSTGFRRLSRFNKSPVLPIRAPRSAP